MHLDLTEFDLENTSTMKIPSFWLRESLPLVNLNFLLFLEAENEADLVEQKVKLMAWKQIEFLESNLKVLNEYPGCKSLLNKAVEAIQSGKIGLADNTEIKTDTNLNFVEVDTLSVPHQGLWNRLNYLHRGVF